MRFAAHAERYLLIFSVACLLHAQPDAVPQALSELQNGNLSSAETILKAQLAKAPHDYEALAVLGPVLDQEKKYAEAEAIYKRALAASHRDSALFNNYGNHLLATGQTADARLYFERVLAVDPGNANANIQLARLALLNKQASQALSRLDHLPAPANSRPDVELLRMQANFLLAHKAEADAALSRLAADAQNDPNRSFDLATALAGAGQYAAAEKFFSRALADRPGAFQVLYAFGVAAAHAGRNEQARGLLELALGQQPDNPDLLYDLAAVNLALERNEAALSDLARAHRLAPGRTDILELLARTSAATGYFGDAAKLWTVYLKAKPADAAARRELAFAQTAVGENVQAASAELHSFVQAHPADAMGHFELGLIEAARAPQLALAQFNDALRLKPDFIAAHVARGLSLYRQGNAPSALADFEYAAQRRPDNGAILGRLGETYLSLGRPADALPVLQKASALLPSDSTILLHLGRALSKLGKSSEAAAVFARCRELGPNRSSFPHPAGLIDFLGLPPDEQLQRYRAGVERTVHANPANAEAQVRYLGILLSENKTERAAAAVQVISSLKPSAALLVPAAKDLLAARQYQLLHDLLEQAAASPQLAVFLAAADAHLKDPAAGLADLDRLPAASRTADFYLARAQILAALGHAGEAVSAARQAVQLNPSDPQLLKEAIVMLVQHGRTSDALDILERVSGALSATPQISLLKALVLALSNQLPASERLFQLIENRWPEWSQAWLAHSLVLQFRGDSQQARSSLDAAIALGAPPVLIALARSTPLPESALVKALPDLLQ